MSGRPRTAACAVLLLAAACGGGQGGGEAAPAVVTVTERFQTARDTLLNIDSPAVWHGPAGEHWLLVTAKTGDVIRIHDAATGALLRDVGRTGTAAGEFRRPNGIAVIDSLAFVVERDNARVQVFLLPAMTPLGSYGDSLLRKPYGVSVHRQANGNYVTFITDNYELVADSIPADSLLGQRVREFRVTVANGAATATPVRAFGETDGPGVLRVVESILADPANDRIMVAEEQEGASLLKVYGMATGRFTGDTVSRRFFPHQAEGIVLYRCGEREGFWIATDQGKEANTFHVFDRATLKHLASFTSATVRNTDGIALTQRGFGDFPAGAFYAVHDDGNVAAFSWADIAKATGLRSDCGAGQ